MSKFVRLAALAGVAATALMAPSANAVCVEFSGGSRRVASVPTPWGTAYVDVPSSTEVSTGQCWVLLSEIVPGG